MASTQAWQLIDDFEDLSIELDEFEVNDLMCDMLEKSNAKYLYSDGFDIYLFEDGSLIKFKNYEYQVFA